MSASLAGGARPGSPPPPVDGHARPEPAGFQRTAAIASVLAGLALVVLGAATTNVVLPTIAQSLHVAPGTSVRVVTIYQLSLVMALLPSAALGESLGYRRVFVAGVAIFTGASALCAAAPSLPWLVAARFVQGLGGAAVMSLAVALLRGLVSHRQLGAAIGWNALAVALASAAGPTVGALILSVASWNWIFAVNVPLGAAVLVAARALPHVPGTARRIDLFSVSLNAGAFASLVFAAESMTVNPPQALAALATGALCLWGLVRRETPKPAPLIPLDLLRGRSFRISVLASVCCFAGQTAGMLALPFLFQHQLGMSALTTGLYLTPWPLTVALAGPIAGRLADRISTAWLCGTGGVLLAAGLASISAWASASRPFELVLLTALCGLGFGLFQVPNNRNMFLAAPRERSGAAGGIQGTARLVGQTAGGLVMTLLFTLASAETAPRLGLGIAAALTLTAGLLSTLRAPRPG